MTLRNSSDFITDPYDSLSLLAYEIIPVPREMLSMVDSLAHHDCYNGIQMNKMYTWETKTSILDLLLTASKPRKLEQPMMLK